MIRSIRPTDVASLLAFLGRGLPNHAKTGRNLLQREPLFSLGRFLREWLSLDENRYTWIDISRGHIAGLISVRGRPSSASWQMDSLLLEASPEDQDVCLRLLDYISAVGGEVGMQKVFLRVVRSSPLAEVARQAGLVSYKSELLYWLESLTPTAEGVDLGGATVRTKRPGDELPLFHFYSAAVPSQVRQAEAMTFDEWKAIGRKDLSLPTQRELVMEREGTLVGCLRVKRGGQANCFDLLALPGEMASLEALLGHCLSLLEQGRSTYCLFPEYREDLRQALEDRGFRLAGEYCSLVKQLAVRIRQPRLAPARI